MQGNYPTNLNEWRPLLVRLARPRPGLVTVEIKQVDERRPVARYLGGIPLMNADPGLKAGIADIPVEMIAQ